MSIYSNKIISYSKYLLIISLILTVLSIIMLHEDSQLEIKPKTKTSEVESNEAKLNSLAIEPRIMGLDINNNPFNIIAQKATHLENSLKMEQIEVTLYLYDNKPTTINADYGVAEIDIKKVTLIDNIKILFEDGDQVLAKNAVIDYNLGIISSDSPIVIKSKSNQIKANGFKVFNEKGKRKIIFYGQAKAQFQSN